MKRICFKTRSGIKVVFKIGKHKQKKARFKKGSKAAKQYRAKLRKKKKK